MRLIDADALKEQIENFNCKNCNHYNFVRCGACQIDDVLTYIDDAPTVDKWISGKEQEPVKPIRMENWWKCPACEQNIVVNMKYCPGCGRRVKWK